MGISGPTPIYDGLLELATDAERNAILAGGAREFLDNNLTFGVVGAEPAYGAINAILSRVVEGIGLCVTGIDPRLMPPSRKTLDSFMVLNGRLLWEGHNGFMSKLQIDFLGSTLHLADLKIEPMEGPSQAAPPITMSRSQRLQSHERIDDSTRLQVMQRYIDKGMLPTTAARKAVVDEPYPASSEASSAKRLYRKFANLVK